ncbi:F-box domain-containing protein [Fusarium falciforme]|uniref:F-box domain-containing protein n=1 Tax=Fusarium falciforme TaxID=195108 RepID=UPI0023016214|nr:F-box domain-containing protein [Fusarium falciforme]WAO84949.1 F-box domain-containing protein [Fusarium falciforme]
MSDCRSKQPPKVLQNSNSCFTSVVLSKIRRIRVSVGIPGRTRSPDHVSGLRFEFWDSKVPVYVGQWFHEVSSLCVERGERITGFTFWQAQESHPNDADFDNSGRITGIRISKLTLGHKEIAFHFGGKDDILVYSFVENSYERLSGLAWSFDHQCGYIYACTQPRPGTSLMLHGITDSRMPGMLCWQFQGSKGNWLQVSGIDAFFIDRKFSGLVFEY